MRWVTPDGQSAATRLPVRASEDSAAAPSRTLGGRSRRSLTVGGVVATGLLSTVVVAPPAGAQHGPSARVAHTPDGLARQPWDATRSVAGELAGRASSAVEIIDLGATPGVEQTRPATLGRTMTALELFAWNQTRSRIGDGAGELAGLPLSVAGTERPPANATVIASLQSAPSGTFTTGPAATADDLLPSVWRHQDGIDVQAALDEAAVRQAAALAAAQQAALVAAQQAAQVEAARLAAEAAAAAQAQEQARIEAEAAEAARLAQVESERLAAEEAAQASQAAQAAAQRRAEEAAPLAPAAAPRAAAPAPAAAPAAPVAVPAAANNTEAIEAAFFNLINQERAAVGLGPLSFNANLRAAARAQAARIAAAGSLFHQDLSPLLAQGWHTAGENVGYGPNIEWLHAAFVASAGHYHNMVNPAYTSLGVGVVVTPDGQIWVGHVFGG